MRNFCLTSLLVFTAGFLSGSDHKSDRPNVVVILIDDMGYADLSCFGNTKVKTPNIDRLAEQGLRLTNYYAMSPVCSPSRSSLITGQYPATLHINSIFGSRKELDRHKMPYYLDTSIPNLSRTLKDIGYATGHFGKWHMGGGRDIAEAPRPTAYGFDESLVSFEGMGDRLLNKDAKHDLHEMSAALGNGNITYVYKHQKTGIYVDSALSFINRHEEPFYLNLWPNDVHDWHLPKSGTEAAFESVTENPYERDFFAVLTAMDREIGRFLDSLASMGKLENTIILLTSDNGPTDWPRYYSQDFYGEDYEGPLYPPGSTEPYKGRKWSLYEGGIRVPFIAYWKDHIDAGIDTTSIMGSLDIFPTLCGLIDVEVPSGCEGSDLSEVLLGKETAPNRTLYWYYEKPKPSPEKSSMRPELAIRNGKWKLVTRLDGSESYLFDIVNDPSEKKDLSQIHPDTKSKLMNKLKAWYAPREP